MRGTEETLTTATNPGNFLALVKLLSWHDDVLKRHLESPRLRNATYLSAQTQNDLLKIIARNYVLKDLVDEIRDAKFYSLMADEVSSHGVEVLAICVRFVDAKKEVREEFINFSRVPRITGAILAATIKDVLSDSNINIENMRGQTYDGAANMASDQVGVQAQIKKDAPNAPFLQCSSHCLNLVITKSCQIQDIRACIDKSESLCFDFRVSAKKSNLLQAVFEHNVKNPHKRKPLIDMCRTRWVVRHTAYQQFFQAFEHIVDALEVIGHGLHGDKYPEVLQLYSDWDSKGKLEAQSFLHAITAFPFIVSFLVTYMYLSTLQSITIKLQSTLLDVIHA